MRGKLALLLCALAAAMFTGAEAFRTLRRDSAPQMPEAVYAMYASRAGEAVCYLREKEGYLAVYAGKRGGEPLQVTQLELALLRRGDQAMIRAGLPVADETELLTLLEDLGS